MPVPINDRPTPPGHPGHQPIEEVDIDGLRISVSHVRKIFAWGQAQRLVIVIPQNQGDLTVLGQSCLDMMLAGQAQDMPRGADALKGILGSFLEVYQVHKRPETDVEGIPARAGAPDAMRTAAWLLDQNSSAQRVVQTAPAWLVQRATQCQFLFSLSDALFDAEKHVSSVAGPLSKEAIKETRVVARLLKPQVEASLQLSTQAEPMYTYLNEPYVKATQTRRSQERRDEKADQRAEERIGAAARTEAREEAEGRMVDAVRALTGQKGDKGDKK
jgi:hypothetical protein